MSRALKYNVGQPHFGALWVLTNALEANSSSVPLFLGWWYVSHLSLLLKIQQYATLFEEEFKAPINPGQFTSSDIGADYQIKAPWEVWKEYHYTFHICQAVERALLLK